MTTDKDRTPTRSPTLDTTSSTGSRDSTGNDSSSVNLNNLGSNFLKDLNNTLVDQLGEKQMGDFRIVFQNPNGVKIYQESDPEYLPSIESLKEADVDMVCLAETNVPWHRNDFFYNVSKQNQITWKNLPVKTVAASCKKVKQTSPNYQPGGCLTIVTNTMTTKIKNATSDYLGRWTKIMFFCNKRNSNILYCVSSK